MGPDLKGVTDRRDEKWLVKFVQDSQQVIRSGDPVAVGLFNKFKQKKMPEADLSAVEIVTLLGFIKGGGAGLEKSVDAKSALEAKPEDAEMGHRFFTGKARLSKGGPACVSCHSAGAYGMLGGGTLGPDLTQTYSLYDDKGLSKVLSKIAFPTMVSVYANKALTKEEVFQIKAYLFQTDRQGVQAAGYDKKFFFLGLVGVFGAFGIIDFFFRGRRKRSSRPTIGGDQ